MDKRIIQQDIVSGVIKEKHMVTDTVITEGDIFYGDGKNNILRLAAPTANSVLKTNGNIPVWTQTTLGVSGADGTPNQTFTSNTPDPVTGSTFTVTLVSAGPVFLAYSADIYLEGQIAGDWDGEATVSLVQNGTAVRSLVMAGQSIGSVFENGNVNTRTQFHVATLPVGVTTFNLEAKVEQGGTGNCELFLVRFRVSAVQLGI